MAVIFVNRYFHPDVSATSQLLCDLAVHLAADGREVHVVTGRVRYDDPQAAPLPSRETVGGVRVHRIWTSRFGRASLPGRAVDDLTFHLCAGWRLWRLARAGDVVVAKTDPPMISVVAAAVCRLRGARLVNWLQDLFPEAAEALGVGGRLAFVYGPLRKLRDASLEAAAVNVAIGETMAARVAGRGVARERVRVVPNWADAAAVRPIEHAVNPFRARVADGAKDPFVAVYSGNLGRAHETGAMLEAMTILAEAERAQGARLRPTRWVFIGGGALTPALKAEVARRGLGSVAFLPYQPRETLAQSLSAADAHLACLRPEFEGLIVPSKVSGAAAAGRPILFVGDAEGEIGRFVARRGCGRSVACGDGAGLAAAIRELADDPALCAAMGRRAREGFEAEFDRGAAFSRWREVLDEAAVAERRA